MKQLYDNNTMRQYLLGILLEAEVELLDELSIVDDDFAARLEAVENDLIDSYVRGELSGRELAEFKSRYLTSPRRLEKVRFARAFQSFAGHQTLVTIMPEPVAVVDEQQARPGEPEQSSLSDNSPVPWLRRLLNLLTVPHLTLHWGLAAAAMLLLATGGGLMVEMLRLRGQLDQEQSERAALQQREKELQAHLEQQQSASARATEQLQEDLKRTREKMAQLERQQEIAARQNSEALATVPNILPFRLSPQMRAPGRAVILTIPSGTDYITLQLELEGDEYPAYRAELLTQTGDRKVWNSSKVRARAGNENKIVNVSIPADRLTTRGYVLMLKGVAADGRTEETQTFTFRVVKQ